MKKTASRLAFLAILSCVSAACGDVAVKSGDAIAASNVRWDDLPGTTRLAVPLSERQRKALAEKAAAGQKSVEAFAQEKILGE